MEWTGLKFRGLEMVRFQLDAQQNFPRGRLFTAGTGSLESSEQPVPERRVDEMWPDVQRAE